MTRTLHLLTITPVCEPLFLAPDDLRKLLTNFGESARDGEKRPQEAFWARKLGGPSARDFATERAGDAETVGSIGLLWQVGTVNY
jgi:hypothetical protein